MLSQHCPKCKTPLFEYEGKIMCPICGGKVVSEETTPIEGEPEAEEVGLEESESKRVAKLKEISQNKLAQLEDELKDETDPEKVNEILKAVKSTLDVLKRLKER